MSNKNVEVFVTVIVNDEPVDTSKELTWWQSATGVMRLEDLAWWQRATIKFLDGMEHAALKLDRLGSWANDKLEQHTGKTMIKRK
ncbi:MULTISPECIES: hypothetical protein [Paenibacillaceae]|uniref:Uncharacterized protein n=1 Tax=Paenibacillus thailandensis TaxID=393250 RepID=A0ABW5QR00_9BACL|nr:hypothetical protein [Cohnella massiliensis]